MLRPHLDTPDCDHPRNPSIVARTEDSPGLSVLFLLPAGNSNGNIGLL